MIRLEIDGTAYRIEWMHHKAVDGDDAYGGSGCTECVISTNDAEGLYIGSAGCHPNDRYVKETGRKISLARTIAHWPREHRVKVWEAYHGRSARAAALVGR